MSPRVRTSRIGLSFVRAEAAAPAVAAIVELLKAVLLPIVTLVLGYYFARGRG